MKKTFMCDCNSHLLKVEYNKKGTIPASIWLGIYDIYSPKTGRKYKKSKLIGDVIFFANKRVNTLKKFMDFIKKIENTSKLMEQIIPTGW